MENTEKRSSGATTGIIVGVVVLLCCLCLLALGIGGYAFYTLNPSGIVGGEDPIFVDPFAPNAPVEENPEITRPPVDAVSSETIETLENSIVPINDPRELACRLDGLRSARSGARERRGSRRYPALAHECRYHRANPCCRARSRAALSSSSRAGPCRATAAEIAGQ